MTTINGGTSLVKTSALTVNPNSQPTITTVLPATALLNSTIYFTVDRDKLPDRKCHDPGELHVP